MDEEEKPPQAEGKDRTLIVPTPAERPREAPARTRTAERKLEIPPQAQGAPARTRTTESKLELPSQAQGAPARTRTTEAKLQLPAAAQAGPKRTRTQELRTATAAERAAEGKDSSSRPAVRTEAEASEPASQTLPGPQPRIRPSAEFVSNPASATLPPPAARNAKEETPPAAVERTVQVPFPEPPPNRPRTATRARTSTVEQRAASVPLPTSAPEPAVSTQPGAPSEKKEAPQARPVERTLVVPVPTPSSQSSSPQVTPLLPAAKKTPALAQQTESEPEEESVPATKKMPALAQQTESEPEEDPLPPTKKTLALAQQAESEPGADPQVGLAHTMPSTRKPAAHPDPEPVITQPQPQAEEVSELDVGMKLGGYQLLDELGAGGMGTVWLANQLSLDREVAVKVLKPDFANDPHFVYRFTQEAFAAAQLIHHNIVQIYDCGSDKQYHFFSMEYVDGQNLQSLLKHNSSLDPEVAAGYVVQAARGLQYAHERGMVHRDIKPENLLLNNNGIVKVADLGLVKLASTARKARFVKPEGPLTYVGKNPAEFPMGTPAYMAPEQVQNSSKVDLRADIYSLGCTLYHLLTGRHPFIAETLNQVMEQHVREPPVPPDKRKPDVPENLSAIVMRMMAKRPEERYQNMAGVIEALEKFLGFEGSSTFAPREHHANLLEHCVEEYNAAKWAKWRRISVLVLTMLSAVVTGVLEWRVGPPWGLAVATFTAIAWMASFSVRGLFEKGALFLRCRQYVFQAPLVTWLIWLLLLGGAGYGLYRFQLLFPLVVLFAGGALFSVGFYMLVDRKVEAERRPPISQVEQMLRSMRLRGLEESALRQFVCTYSGENWEGFFEALFGYDAKMVAREKWGLNSRELPREKHSSWRDPLIRWLDLLQAARRRRRERRQLRVLETKQRKALKQQEPPPQDEESSESE